MCMSAPAEPRDPDENRVLGSIPVSLHPAVPASSVDLYIISKEPFRQLF